MVSTLKGTVAMLRPLNHASGCVQAFATSDLSLEFDARGKDEIAELLTALKHMQTSLAQVVGRARHSAESETTAGVKIAPGNLDLRRVRRNRPCHCKRRRPAWRRSPDRRLIQGSMPLSRSS